MMDFLYRTCRKRNRKGSPRPVSDGQEYKDSTRLCVRHHELVFNHREDGRQDYPDGKVEKPQEPEEKEEEKRSAPKIGILPHS